MPHPDKDYSLIVMLFIRGVSKRTRVTPTDKE